MLSPKDSPRGQLLQKFVRARVPTLEGIDVARYEYDWNNALYYFVVNPESEQIYLRYGGRDNRAADSYLDFDAFEIALRRGLDLHERWKAGDYPSPADGDHEPLYPSQIAALQKMELTLGRCAECHLVGDYRTQEKEGAFVDVYERIRYLWPSPDLLTLGIRLDVPKGLVIDEVSGAAAASGLVASDEIVAVEGVAVRTFGDLQYQLDQLARSVETLALSVQRQGEVVDIEFQLPERWWFYDNTYRYLTIDPAYYFSEQPVDAAFREQLGLADSSFACEITKIDPRAQVLELHDLQVGDRIVAIDGVSEHPLADRCGLYIELTADAGDEVPVRVVRGDETLELTLKTHRQYYRKTPPPDSASSAAN